MRILIPLTLLFIAFLINALPGYGQGDLKISVTASHINADPGDEITYVIKYMNAGLTTASNVIITSQLPDMGTYTYVSSNPQGVVSGNEITWNQSQIPELALLSSGERQITVTVKAGTPGSGDTQYSSGYYIPSATAILNSYATIKSNSTLIPLHSNTVSTTIVQNYNVHINNASGVIKSATGTTIYYMIQVSNNGNVYDRYNLSSLNYDCDGPDGMDYDKLSASFTDLNGNAITKTDWIEPDQAYFFLLKLTAPNGTNPGKWSCHDVIATSSASGSSGVGKIQTQTDGAPHYPLVSLSKIDDKDPVEAGELLTYTIYAFNSNDSYAANNFIIKEAYPPNVSFVRSTPAPDPGFDNQWSLGDLAYGLAGAKTINITLRVNSLSNCGGIITNTVSAYYDGCDASNPPKATVVTTIKSYPDLVITKTAKLSSTPAKKGESITCTLNYQNIGTCDAPNSLIKDLFDEVHTNIVNAGGGTQSGSEISWNLGTLTPGQSGSITYTALIDPGSTFNPGTTIITNKAIISTSENESNLNNNTSAASIPVSVLPDMKVEVLSEKMIMEPGKENTYTLKISNIGDIAASNVEIKNQLPTGLNVGFISDGGTNLDGSIAWPVISTFEVGSSVEYQVKVTPSCSFIPSITSITTVTSSIIDKDESNNSVTVHSIVQDITEPVLADVPTNMTIGCDDIPAVGTPKASDNCDSTPVIHYLGEVSTRGTDPLMLDYYNYTLTRTWDASDASGNHSMPGTQVITVRDVVAPVAPVLQDVTVGECSGTPTAPTTTDICKGTVIGTTSTVFPITQQGTTVVEWTFDDGNGNVITTNQNVIIDDITAPVPDMASLPEATGECSVTVTAPTATDNCKGKVTATTTDPLSYSAQGSYTIHWMYDDGNGNTSNQSQKVVVDDITPPVTPILADITVGECSGTPVAPTTTDNCSGVITGTTSTVFPIAQQGTTVVEWTFDDGNGNTTSASQNVIVEDTTSPEVPILADVTIGECSGTPVAPTTIDDCTGTLTGTTSTIFPITKQGTAVVIWTFDDGNGNVTTASQNVIVDDVTAPVPDLALLADVTGECSATATAPTATDNCSGVITATTTDPLTYTSLGRYTIHWSYDDGNGNISTQQQMVIVEDTTPPVTPVLADVTAGECSGTPIVPTTSDNCKGTITGTTSTVFPITQQGVTVVTWTFDDGNGNVTTTNQNVIVDDITSPVADVTDLPTITGECLVTVTAPTATDNCKGKITATTTDPLTYSAQGSYTIHWMYDDGNGNISTQTQSVVVKDITAPETPVLADVFIGECSGTPPIPTTMDNCKGIISGTSSIVFPKTKQGKHTIIWTFDDGNGNVTTAYQNLILDDITAPVPDIASLPEITAECSVTATAPTATDNCIGKIIATTTDPLTYSVQGSYTIHWTYDDGNGNISVQTQSVVVKDVTPPVVPVLADITVGECSGTPVAPTTTDNCSEIITGTTTTVFPITQHGTTVVSWTFDDGNGNVTTAYQNLILEDVTAPVPDITFLPEITAECSVTVTAPTATDNCKGKITASTTDPLTYSAQGTYTIHWTYDDGNGNTSTQLQSVVVDDITPPETPVLADVFIGECSGTPPIPTTMDNCKGIISGTSSIVFPKTKQGKHTIIWTFDDGNGNVTTAYQNLILDDITAPVPDIASLPEITAECSVTATVPTATDNCKGKITATTTDPLTYFTQGSYTIHWTYDDGNGNTSTQLQSVIVDDITPPVIPILADITVGECSGTPLAPTTTDNCSGVITGTTSTVFPITKQGVTVVEWTFDDGNGNVTTASQNVIVDDVTAPVPDIASLPEATGECSVTVTAPTATDNCKGTITATTTDPLTYSTQGSYTIQWIYDDGNGNTSTQTQSVVVDDVTPPEITGTIASITVDGCSVEEVTPAVNTVAALEAMGLFINDGCTEDALLTVTSKDVSSGEIPVTVTRTYTIKDVRNNSTNYVQTIVVTDTQKPTIECPADLNVTIDAGNCNVTNLLLGVPIANDNCSISSVSNDAPSIFGLGTTVVTWTVSDKSGNTATCQQNVNVDGSPVAIDDKIDGDENSKITGNVMTNDLGLCDNSVQMHIVSEPQFGSLTPASNGNFEYIPQDKYSGTDMFTYQICDRDGDCSTATVEITVNNVNDLPLAVADNENLQVDVTLNGNVAANDVLSDDGDNVWALVNAPSNGTINFNQDGTYTYTPHSDFIGNDNFSYELCDSNGDCSTAMVTIVVEDVLIPNQILTPNADDHNDTFIIKGIEYYPTNKVTIYNRWGNIVYKKNNYQNEWDGNSNVSKVGSKSLPLGTYFYLIDYANNRHKTGFVYLDK